MRVYHFVNAFYGIEDIQRRRLKIATLNELNDPFELFGVSLSDANLRRAFQQMKEKMATDRGLLCFSRNWKNPVQWSHYADKHSGICLGFDVPDELLITINYSGRRLAVAPERFINPKKMDENTAIKFFSTKFAHWKYENEVRLALTLEDKDSASGHYFAEFSERLILREIIVGAQSRLTRMDIADAVGELDPAPTIFKARLAFASFKVVRQRKASLWA